MSEQQAEEPRGETGSVAAGSTVSHSSEASAEAAAALAVSVLESLAIAPDHEALPKADTPKADTLKVEAPKLEVPTPEIPRASGKVLIMAPSDRAWHDHSASAEVKSETRKATAPVAPKRGFLATAAMLALAVMAGAIGGALATSGLTHVAGAAAPSPGTGALEASIARLDADVATLKAGLDHTSKQGVNQFNRTSERLDKIEKAQAEPNVRLAKLTEAVDKLRATPAVATPATVASVPAAASAVPKDITGSVSPQTVAAATPAPAISPVQAAPPKSEVGRLPAREGWSLTDVGYGGALIRNRRGTFEVYAGDYIPGLGRIDAIRKQDGQWVVVTSKGLVVRR